MQINSINYANTLNKTLNASKVSFGHRPLDYTYSRPGTYLPHNQEVFVSDDTVLLLGGENTYDGYIFGLGGDNLKNAFKYKRDDDVITVGRQGNIKIPDMYSDVSRQHLEIRRAQGGYIVKDISKFGTKISKYKDFSSKPEGTLLPKGLEVIVKKDTVLKLSRNTQINLADFSTNRALENIQSGKAYTIGREGDIPVGEKDREVSRKHIEITKYNDFYIVRDISTNGTAIGSKMSSYSQNNGYKGTQSSYQSQYGQYNQYGQEQYQRQQRNAYDIPPKKPAPQNEKFDCSEECQKDLEALFLPFKQLKFGEKVSPEINSIMRKQFRQLAMKYHPDLSNGSDRDFKELQKQCQKKGLVDDKGHWIS